MANPKIDFYIISEKTTQAVLLFICRLVEKAYQNQKSALIYVDDEKSAQKINDLLWTFRDISFIPHEIIGDNSNASIQIGYGNQRPVGTSDILFNLASTVPIFANEFNRIIEIAPEEPTWQNSARQNFRYYKSQGYEMNSHDLKNK